MGIFGRDDRSEGDKPQPAAAGARQRGNNATTSPVTLIAASSLVEGEIKGAGDLRIEGTVKGKIDCSAMVVVADGGRVDGELRAETTSIAGTVEGNVVASQKLELTPTAKVQGDITAPRILIREGANFEGQVFMTGGKKKPSSKPSQKPDDTAPASGDSNGA